GETPLTPLFGRELLNDSAASDPATRDTLTFLTYREKLLAGSWRFDTYFGRDTLMAVRLLMPVLSATAVEAGLSSVLARLSVQGEVARSEEHTSELQSLRHLVCRLLLEKKKPRRSVTKTLLRTMHSPRA